MSQLARQKKIEPRLGRLLGDDQLDGREGLVGRSHSACDGIAPELVDDTIDSMAPEQTAPTTETCPACGAIIDTTENDPMARVPCPKCGEKVRVQRAFNNFELVETVGIGGMGTVYKATDTLLDRFVALKLLRKDLGDEIDYATRLQQEARVAASVSHPNVIQVSLQGKDHGQFYLVMGWSITEVWTPH